MTANYPLERFSTARFAVKEAYEAKWARRIAVFFVQLLILTALLHRFAGLGTPATMNLIGVSMVGLLIAVIIALVSLVRIWFGGQTGAAQDFAALVLGLAGLALPGYFIAKAVLLPPLDDIQTTPTDPIHFTALLGQRPTDANPLTDPTPQQAAMEAKAYPDIKPMYLERAAPEVFSLVSEVVNKLGWTVVVNETPGESGVGRIEATDKTMIMGFTDDVVIRVKGDDAHTLIDMRSASRYGTRDFGANADRIRKFYAEVTAALEKGETTALEQAEAKEEKPAAKPAEPVKKKRVRRARRTR